MKTLKFGSTGLEFVNGELQLVSDQEEITQSARILLSINKGEWFLNPELGIDQRMFLGKDPSEGMMEDEIREALLEYVEDITTIDEVTFIKDPKIRKLNVNFIATSITGETITNEEGVIFDAD
ncbi:DUF2634 domain-containing protein [Paenibacillus sp. Marseille-Q4541]|uniref:DUF2634 domain-containing protein n=1 Tax=Paenibacillus sp. Marseille-Q4541 TaxID=2831522 RepID=UPI001BAA7322|nr:DUF2634 domain-containing protein [Paenibacillus sp. Marseille-Q4541]